MRRTTGRGAGTWGERRGAEGDRRKNERVTAASKILFFFSCSFPTWWSRCPRCWVLFAVLVSARRVHLHFRIAGFFCLLVLFFFLDAVSSWSVGLLRTSTTDFPGPSRSLFHPMCSDEDTINGMTKSLPLAVQVSGSGPWRVISGLAWGSFCLEVRCGVCVCSCTARRAGWWLAVPADCRTSVTQQPRANAVQSTEYGSPVRLSKRADGVHPRAPGAWMSNHLSAGIGHIHPTILLSASFGMCCELSHPLSVNVVWRGFTRGRDTASISPAVCPLATNKFHDVTDVLASSDMLAPASNFFLAFPKSVSRSDPRHSEPRERLF